MAENSERLSGNSPDSSPGDAHRPGGLTPCRQIFLHGCKLPAAWAHQPQWRILETGFDRGLNFLLTWQAWKADPQRPHMLHFVAIEAGASDASAVLRQASSHPELRLLAEQLHAQLWGLLPGFHRLVFENGQVLLTLCIGEHKAMLREQDFEADSVYLKAFEPSENPGAWDVQALKALARCCRRGTRLAGQALADRVPAHFQQTGFLVEEIPDSPAGPSRCQGEYNPPWAPRKSRRTATRTQRQPARCVVIGAGLAGASTAASLARRGWQVEVLDQFETPAAGASGLPAGMLVPHVSPDDSLLSRLSRCGVRATLWQAAQLLQEGLDWQASGVLERRLSNKTGLPADWPEAGRDWSEIASPQQLAKVLSAEPDNMSTLAYWHHKAGWIKPTLLVKALLAQPGICWRGGCKVDKLQQNSAGTWQAMNAEGDILAQADLVVLAAAHASQSWVAGGLGLQAIRGQVSWGLQNEAPTSAAAAFPKCPVNGDGSFIPGVPTDEGLAWLTGASFERDQDHQRITVQDQQANFGRLLNLLPATASHLAAEFRDGQARAWAGVRCASPDRLPLIGPVDPAGQAGLWVNTAMGSRGLTFSILCAELLAAQLHGEPLALENRLAQALAAQRFAHHAKNKTDQGI